MSDQICVKQDGFSFIYLMRILFAFDIAACVCVVCLYVCVCVVCAFYVIKNRRRCCCHDNP